MKVNFSVYVMTHGWCSGGSTFNRNRKCGVNCEKRCLWVRHHCRKRSSPAWSSRVRIEKLCRSSAGRTSKISPLWFQSSRPASAWWQRQSVSACSPSDCKTWCRKRIGLSVDSANIKRWNIIAIHRFRSLKGKFFSPAVAVVWMKKENDLLPPRWSLLRESRGQIVQAASRRWTSRR